MYFKEDDTNVCSLLRIANLGGKVVTAQETLMYQNDEDYGVSGYDSFVKELREMCKVWDDRVLKQWSQSAERALWDRYYTKYVPKMVIQAVTATPGQEDAEAILEQIGFQKSGPFSKLKHPGTKLTFWMMSGDDFCQSIGYTSKYDPRVTKEVVCAA